MQQIISLTKEENKKLADKIQDFYYERNKEIGIIETNDLIELFLNELGINIYNKALDDAKSFYDKYNSNASIDYYNLYKNK